MYSFDYHRPRSVDDAVRQLGGEAKLLAGGQTFIPTLKQRLAQPDKIVDLGGIAELSGIKVEGDAVVIGAMTRHGAVAASAEVAKAIPALAKLAGGIGDPQVRNMGTLGGSVANNDPAADYPAALLGLGASVETNKRTVAADDFFTGMFETALGEDEIITRVRFPVPQAAGYAKFANPASRYALVGVFVARTPGGVRVAVTGAGPGVFRIGAMETALAGNFSAGAIDGVSVSADGLNSDMHGSAEYRAHLVTVMAKRAIAAAGG
ncbi:FAD binding domain-containing protein [Oceanibacterium hippocampi]|uniref:Carbon monoxide dehydrogenase medium chain n=1 Tax=Oceanibacterium hippocampi TaxID=745714 RepID=A0A1Y5TYF3_9PROT|nr:xanthine dehydrogenase family protein subunit M [Oceanibacterium hippocampi]SLN76909.1 Carbon monoxide dehydrogenase medium chain [Oceanibacterium hippocampi]